MMEAVIKTDCGFSTSDWECVHGRSEKNPTRGAFIGVRGRHPTATVGPTSSLDGLWRWSVIDFASSAPVPNSSTTKLRTPDNRATIWPGWAKVSCNVSDFLWQLVTCEVPIGS